MADATEDTIQNPQDDVDPTDEVADFRFLASQKLPSRGTKDFEPHGTKLQQSTLEASRQAMHNALSHTRTHVPNNTPLAIWDPGSNGAWVINPSGKWTTSVGQSKSCPGKGTRLWLLPEEVIWLVDRGTLDLRWPANLGEEEDAGLPMSLQAAYAVFIKPDAPYKLNLEMYSVYAHLKRAGYIVLRAHSNRHNVPADPNHQPLTEPHTFLQFLSRLVAQQQRSKPSKLGPLVRPGIYRDYNSIFNHLESTSFQNPRSHLETQSSMAFPPLDVTFHVYKTQGAYKKTNPGPPDFYISVLDARQSVVPSEPQLQSLLAQTPYHAPVQSQSLSRRLKDGHRNVILAVVDQGVTSFLSIADAGFSCEKLWAAKEIRTEKIKGPYKGNSASGSKSKSQ